MKESAAARLAALVTVLGCAVAQEGPTPSSEELPSSGGNLGLAGSAGSESAGSGGTNGGTGGAGGTGGGKAGSGGSGGASGGSSGTGGATAGTGGSGGNAGTGGGASGSGGSAGKGGAGGSAGTTSSGGAGAGGSSGKGGSGGAGTGGSSGKGGSGGTTAGTGGSAGTGSPGGTVLLDEDFESGTDGWSILGQAASDWTLVSDGSMVFQAANAPGSNSFRAQRAGATTWTDVRATARIKVTGVTGSNSDRFAGLCVRVRDDVTYYCLAIRGDDKLAIRYRQGSGGSGMNSTSVNFALELNTWYDAEIEAVGTTVTGRVGSTTVSVDDITTASGNVAIAVPGINARFDDVLVTTP